jgi:ABC-type multidrug transport system, ATPase component
MMENIIEVRNLCHHYGKNVIYEDLSFTVGRGKIFGLLGKNGVGKTTLINILMGFLRPTSGRCLVLGEDSHNLSPATREKIGLLFEGHLAYEFMSIGQIEKFYSSYYPNWDRDIYYGLVERMGLSHNHKISKMSCGQRSQVVLGLILAQNPELMILDDYSMGLDAGYRRLFLDFLTEFVKEGNRTVFVTSHIVQDLEQLVDEVIFLGKGGNILQTSLEMFMTGFRQYRFECNERKHIPTNNKIIHNVDIVGNRCSVYSFEPLETVETYLKESGLVHSGLEAVPMSLEDAFIGLSGKY